MAEPDPLPDYCRYWVRHCVQPWEVKYLLRLHERGWQIIPKDRTPNEGRTTDA